MASSDRTLDVVQTINQLRADVARLEALGTARWGAPSPAAGLGLVGYAQPTAAGQTGITAVTDLTGLTVTATSTGDRLWQITFFVGVQQVTSTGTHNITLATGAGTAITQPGATLTASSFAVTGGSVIVQPVAGTNTYKIRAQTSAGTLTINQGATAWNTLVIVDVGPA